jgi:hypothetical protein
MWGAKHHYRSKVVVKSKNFGTSISMKTFGNVHKREISYPDPGGKFVGFFLTRV